jgi:uncharacterized protein YeaO (DUF488 family)
MSVQIKRIYDPPAASDGYRVLVDRLWPRGVTKDRARLDLWLKEIAPSAQLRTWFGHKPDRFLEFSAKYSLELDLNPAVGRLRQIIQSNKQTTLLYAARNTSINHAAVLADYLGYK